MGQGSTLALPSPDQQWVAFTRENDLWLWDVARGAATRATQVGAPYDQRYASVFVLLTAWSADSRRLLFHVSAGNLECVDCDRPDFELRPAEYGFFFYDLESGAVRGLGSDLPGQFEAWLPDGEFLLSSPESRLTQAVLMRFNPAGRRTTPLKLPAGGYGQIDVSHSGQAFVTSFGLERDGRLASQILRVDLNSGQATALTPVGDWAAYQWPRFSPSGERVAYIRQLELPGSRWPPRVLMVGERRLLDCSEELKNLDFRWVNDSTLAASCGNEVFVVDADSGEVRGRQPVE
jgi:Tol biopolymer transport system component